MRVEIIIAAVILGLAIFGGLKQYADTNRFEIVAFSGGTIPTTGGFKLDKRDGRVWWLVHGRGEKLLGPMQDASQ